MRHRCGGAVDTVASDHSCYDLSQKRERADDVRFMPHGLPGVETRMPVTFTALLEHAAASGRPVESVLERFVALFSAAPARINALPGKGAVAPGRDADLVVFDPTEERVVHSSTLHMGSDFSPFEGRRLRGWPQVVVSAGQVVLDDTGFHDPGPVGSYLARHGFHDSVPSSVQPGR